MWNFEPFAHKGAIHTARSPRGVAEAQRGRFFNGILVAEAQLAGDDSVAVGWRADYNHFYSQSKNCVLLLVLW